MRLKSGATLPIVVGEGDGPRRRDGKRTMYRTDAEGLRTVHDWAQMFSKYWRGQLQRIKSHAEEKR